MTRRLWVRAAAAALMLGPILAGPAPAAPVPSASFAAIDAALSSSQGALAQRLADAALNAPGLDDADHARLLLDRGLSHNLQGDAENALADLTAAVNAHSLTNPEQARAYLERGLILDGMNRLDDAIGDYGAALRLDPNSAPALNNRANAYRRQNRFEDARLDYLASLAAGNPAPEYPYYGLGQIAEGEGKPDQARNFYARAVAANPGYGLAAARLAALGGAPPAAGVITLKPPAGTAAAESAPVVLHPPPPPAQAKLSPAPFRPAPIVKTRTVKPAGYFGRDEGTGLRPALDNPGGKPVAQEVQLGAWRQEAEAEAGWKRALAASGGVLAGLSPHIVAVDLPGRGRYYRLRVAAPDGKQLCAALTARGLDCIPARD